MKIYYTNVTTSHDITQCEIIKNNKTLLQATQLFHTGDESLKTLSLLTKIDKWHSLAQKGLLLL